MMNPTKFGSPHLDTPSSRYEFEVCIQICENKSRKQFKNRLIAGARKSTGPCQRHRAEVWLDQRRACRR